MSSRLRRLPLLLWRATVNFYRDDGLNLAAGVAFYSLLSLGPLIYLGGLVFSRAFDDGTALRDAMSHLSPMLPARAYEALEGFAVALRDRGEFVLLAAPGLVWVASSAFSALEFAINKAFATAPRRRFWRSRLKALALLGLGAALLASTLVVPAIVPRLQRAAGLELDAGGLWQALQLPLLLAATYAIFVLYFKLLPRGRVAWHAAASGAALSLILWEGARRLFGGLLARSTAFSVLSGALAGVVAFLMWMHAAVALILLGAELAAVLNGNRAVSGPESDEGSAA